jgi:hypothetical protein
MTFFSWLTKGRERRNHGHLNELINRKQCGLESYSVLNLMSAAETRSLKHEKVRNGLSHRREGKCSLWEAGHAGHDEADRARWLQVIAIQVDPAEKKQVAFEEL